MNLSNQLNVRSKKITTPQQVNRTIVIFEE